MSESTPTAIPETQFNLTPDTIPEKLTNTTVVLLLMDKYYNDNEGDDWLSLIKERITRHGLQRIQSKKCQTLLDHIKTKFKDHPRSQALIDVIQAEIKARKIESGLHLGVAVVDFLPIGPARWVHDATIDGEWYADQKKKIEQGLPTDMPIDQIYSYMWSRHIDMVKQMDEYDRERNIGVDVNTTE